jgi:RNA polymerase sigma-70 factor (ECF subfamily)
MTEGAGALLVRVAAGDRAALRMVYESCGLKLLAVAQRIVSDRAEAEDIVQDVFVTVWKKAAEYDPARASGEAWLTAITRNRAIDRIRARGRRDTVGDAALAAVPDPHARADRSAEAADAHRAVTHALATLDPKHAAVIRGAWLEGLSYEELSTREGVPVGTIKTWVFRGLRRMRESLDG